MNYLDGEETYKVISSLHDSGYGSDNFRGYTIKFLIPDLGEVGAIPNGIEKYPKPLHLPETVGRNGQTHVYGMNGEAGLQIIEKDGFVKERHYPRPLMTRIFGGEDFYPLQFIESKAKSVEEPRTCLKVLQGPK